MGLSEQQGTDQLKLVESQLEEAEDDLAAVQAERRDRFLKDDIRRSQVELACEVSEVSSLSHDEGQPLNVPSDCSASVRSSAS